MQYSNSSNSWNPEISEIYPHFTNFDLPKNQERITYNFSDQFSDDFFNTAWIEWSEQVYDSFRAFKESLCKMEDVKLLEYLSLHIWEKVVKIDSFDDYDHVFTLIVEKKPLKVFTVKGWIEEIRQEADYCVSM